jgi:peptide methionine sulfoxide reductase MsrA
MDRTNAQFLQALFLGIQDLICSFPGVITTRVGYTGGKVANATYRNHDGHAEAIEIIFDPKQLTYRRLLDTHFPSRHKWRFSLLIRHAVGSLPWKGTGKA